MAKQNDVKQVVILSLVFHGVFTKLTCMMVTIHFWKEKRGGGVGKSQRGIGSVSNPFLLLV